MEEIVRTFGINWKLLLVQAANFGLLLVVLWYFLYRPVVRMIDARRAKIAQGVEDAEAATAQRAEIERSKSGILTHATREAETFLSLAKKRAVDEEKRLLAEAEGKGARLLMDSQKRAAEEREAVMKETRDDIARLAVLAAEKVIREGKK